MGIQHTALNFKRIIIFVLGLCAFASPVQANSLFTVENITVDVTAENSVQAQDRAFEQAQKEAFRVLAQRMVADTQDEAVPMPDPITLSTMIQDYETTNEKISAVRYVGTYTFRFREKAVARLFSKSGVRFTETSSKTLLILPVLSDKGKTTIWSEDNEWLHAWSRGNVSSRLVPIKVPIGDLADISDIDDNNALRYERLKLERMLGRYEAKEAAIVIAAPEERKSVIKVSIYRTDRGRAEFVKELHVSYDKTHPVHDAYDKAVEDSVTALRSDWKRKTAFSAAQNQNYVMRLPVKTLKQWLDAKEALIRVPGVTNLSVVSLKPVEVRVAFIFRGDERRLQDVLSNASFNLEGRNPDGSYNLSDGRVRKNGFYFGSKEEPVPFNATKQTF